MPRASAIPCAEATRRGSSGGWRRPPSPLRSPKRSTIRAGSTTLGAAQQGNAADKPPGQRTPAPAAGAQGVARAPRPRLRHAHTESPTSAPHRPRPVAPPLPRAPASHLHPPEGSALPRLPPVPAPPLPEAPPRSHPTRRADPGSPRLALLPVLPPVPPPPGHRRPGGMSHPSVTVHPLAARPPRRRTADAPRSPAPAVIVITHRPPCAAAITVDLPLPSSGASEHHVPRALRLARHPRTSSSRATAAPCTALDATT